jgi:hypothetical protein
MDINGFLDEIDALLETRLAVVTRINDYYERILSNHRSLEKGISASTSSSGAGAGTGPAAAVVEQPQQQQQQQQQQQRHHRSNMRAPNDMSRSLSEPTSAGEVAAGSSVGPDPDPVAVNANQAPTLDDILSKARAIRSHQKGPKPAAMPLTKLLKMTTVAPSAAATTDTDPRPDSQGLVGGNDQYQSGHAAPFERAHGENKRRRGVAKYETIAKSLKTQRPRSCVAEACGLSSKEYRKLSKHLSEQSGHLVYPPSAPYRLAKTPQESDDHATNLLIDQFLLLQDDSNRQVDNAESGNEFGSIDKAQLSVDDLETLTRVANDVRTSIQRISKTYEKTLKSRLTRISAVQLSRDDVNDVLYVWFKLQRLYEVYETLVEMKQFAAMTGTSQEQGKRLGNSVDKFDDLQQWLRSIEMLPLCTPIHGISKLSSSRSYLSKQVKTEDWLTRQLHRVRAHHAKLDANVKLAIQSTVGKTLVKEIIAELKHCCQKEVECGATTASTSSGAGSSNKGATNSSAQLRADAVWKPALMKYRDAYCALVDDCERYDAVYFMKPSAQPVK